MFSNNKKFILLFLIVFISSIFVMPIVNADTPCNCSVCVEERNKTTPKDGYYCRICSSDASMVIHDVGHLSFSQKLALEWNDILYSGDWYGDKEDPTKVDETLNVKSVLRFDVNSGTFATLWNLAEVLYNVMIPIGIILASVYVFIELGDKVASDNATPETIVRAFLKIVLATFFIENGFLVCTFIATAATAVFDEIAKTNVIDATGCLYADFPNKDFVKGMAKMSDLFLPWLIMLFTKFIISIMCWARVLDITVKIILAPIGMSDITVTGTKGSGWGFFKKLAGSALQGAIMIAIVKSYAVVLQVIGEMTAMSGVPKFSIVILCAVVTLVAIIKSQGYASEIIT